MAKLQSIPRLILTYSVAMLTGVAVALVILFKIITNGPSKFFYRKEYTKRPKCMMDPVYGQHGYVTLKSGIKLHTVTAGDPNKPLMLFVHGFPENWYSWRHQIKEFSKDYRTFAIDMRGFGESDKPAGVSNYHSDLVVEDFKELLDGIGEKKCILVAHDFGGAIAQLFTLRYPSMVEKLILCNMPHVRAFRKHQETSWSQQKKSWYFFFFQLPWLPEMMLKANDYRTLEEMFSKPIPGTKRKAVESPEDWDAFKFALSINNGLTTSVNYYRAAMRYVLSHQSTWIITVPTLFIFGIHDEAIDAQVCELSRPFFVDFQLDYIDDADHWVQQAAPDKVNKSIRAYLAKNKT